MRRLAALLVACGVAVSCGGSGSPRASGSSGPARGWTPTPCSCPHLTTLVPQPDAWIPRQPQALAGTLTATTVKLRTAIDRWTAKGGAARTPPIDVQLFALYQQRIYRVLANHPRLSSAVLPWLRGSVAVEARTNIAAARELFSLAGTVTKSGSIHTQPPLPAGVLLDYYREAQRRFGVSWQVLAAVNYVESKFGRVVSASSAGAQGPMQFIPSTWNVYGMGGDIHDPYDAILGAANYLHRSGAPRDNRGALYHYNPVRAYVDAVMRYARQMMRDPRTFYAYYNWQVFVFTKRGDTRLTGPGL
jgi:soluble lytic murein transglycosylase-like protein